MKGATSDLSYYKLDVNGVSIHAPVKGATEGIVRARPVAPVSIHAPVKGATITPDEALAQLPVSIHAPVKGATKSSLPSPSHGESFNPRAREGRDPMLPSSSIGRRRFQSTRP